MKLSCLCHFQVWLRLQNPCLYPLAGLSQIPTGHLWCFSLSPHTLSQRASWIEERKNKGGGRERERENMRVNTWSRSHRMFTHNWTNAIPPFLPPFASYSYQTPSTSGTKQMVVGIPGCSIWERPCWKMAGTVHIQELKRGSEALKWCGLQVSKHSWQLYPFWRAFATLNKGRNSYILSFPCFPGMLCLPLRCDSVYGLVVQSVLCLKLHLLPCSQKACCMLRSGVWLARWCWGSAHHFLTQQTLPVSFLHLLACLHMGWRGLAEFIASLNRSLYHSQGLSLCCTSLHDLVFPRSYHLFCVLWNLTAFYPQGLSCSLSWFMSFL